MDDLPWFTPTSRMAVPWLTLAPDGSPATRTSRTARGQLPLCPLAADRGDYLQQRNHERKWAISALGKGRRVASCAGLGLGPASGQTGAQDVAFPREKDTQLCPGRRARPAWPRAQALTPHRAVSGGRTLGSNPAAHEAAG